MWKKEKISITFTDSNPPRLETPNQPHLATFQSWRSNKCSTAKPWLTSFSPESICTIKSPDSFVALELGVPGIGTKRYDFAKKLFFPELSFGITHLDSTDNILHYPSMAFETKLRVITQRKYLKKNRDFSKNHPYPLNSAVLLKWESRTT